MSSYEDLFGSHYSDQVGILGVQGGTGAGPCGIFVFNDIFMRTRV